jgi:hypothetical protein
MRQLAELIGIGMPESSEVLTLPIPYQLTRTGQALRLIQEDGRQHSGAVDPALINLLTKARKWWAVLSHGEIDIATLAKQEGVNDSYVTRVVRCAFLSPQLVEAILAGRQRRGLSAAVIRTAATIPERWDDQHRLYL